ncbi:MAG: transposase, partial [Myxococcales bacterium]|jgi:transposase|nr:transposase [Myxococcales bacterium]
LLEAGLPVARVNSKRVRDFGKAMGFLAKTDALDAKLLAEFAQRIAPPPPSHAPEDPQAETLVSLVHRRRQISDMIVAEKNRLCRASAVVKRDIEAHLRWLKERLGEIDRRFDATIEVNDAWMAKAKDLSLH